MACTQFSIEVVKEKWGVRSKLSNVKSVPPLPEQILGAVPVRQDLSLCPDYPCEVLCVIEGDFNSFLFEYPNDTTLDEYKLESWDGSVWSEVITGNPNNYLSSENGTKFDLGFYSNNELLGGYKLEWELVFSNYGAGTYRFKTGPVNVSEEQYSFPFKLKKNTCENKDRTIVITCESNGIFSNRFYTNSSGLKRQYDVTGLSWEDSVRLGGRLINDSDTIEKEITHFGNYSRERQITDVETNYNLIIFEVTYEIYTRLIYYVLDSDNLILTDNGSDSEYTYQSLDLIFLGEHTKGEKFVNVRKIYNSIIQLQDNRTSRNNKC